MKEITVVTNDELETAIKMKYDIIFVVGDLVEKIKKTETLKKFKHLCAYWCNYGNNFILWRSTCNGRVIFNSGIGCCNSCVGSNWCNTFNKCCNSYCINRSKINFKYL